MEIVDCSLAGSNLWILNTLPRSATWANFLCLVPTPTLCNNIGVNIPAVCKHQKYSAARGWWHFCLCSCYVYNEGLDTFHISFYFTSPPYLDTRLTTFSDSSSVFDVFVCVCQSHDFNSQYVPHWYWCGCCCCILTILVTWDRSPSVRVSPLEGSISTKLTKYREQWRQWGSSSRVQPPW